jgi:hypothetical protein
MDKMPKLLLLLCVLSSGMLYAQSGKVEIIEDPFVSQEIQRRIEATDTAQIPGFRIQIYFGSDMYKAEEVKEQFSADFPEYASQVYRKFLVQIHNNFIIGVGLVCRRSGRFHPKLN